MNSRAAIRQNVCRVSVHTIVLMPLLWVYIHTRATEPTAITQDQTDEIQFGCRSQHTGEQEEERAGTVGIHADACTEVSVDTCQIQPVVKRQQYVCYDHIAEEESEYGLHIRHVHSANHARYGYESHAGNCSANHAEGDYIPG